MTKPLISILLFAFILKAAVSLNAQDMPLSDVLIDGENWELVAEGYQFTDAACADAYGSFYFADVAKGTSINRISPDGKVSVHIDGTPRISGLKFGPDGRLFACTQNPKKQVVAFDKAGKMTVLVEEAQPNDLVVRYDGRIYFTETGKHQVTLIDRDSSVRAVDVGIKAPNGISLSADQETLAVSDYGGTNVWTFRIESNGSLSGKEPYMMLRPSSSNQGVAKGDGMTTDQTGRYYVTSDLGIQMFDPTGRLGGIISKPQNKGTVSVAFAGRNLDYLYAASSDKIYRRKTKAKGVLFFQSLR